MQLILTSNEILVFVKMTDEFQQRLEGFLAEILANRNFDKLSIEFPCYDSSGGYAAEIIFAKVTGEKNGDKEILDIIIKKSRDSVIAQESLNLRKAYISEVNMYSKLIPYLQKFAKKRNCQHYEHIPHCYGTIARDNQYIVFLENLKLRGYKLHEIGTHHDIEHNKIILQAYAKLHALCFALRDQEPGVFQEFMESTNSPFNTNEKLIDFSISSVHNELDNVITIYGEKNKPLIVEKLKTLKEKYEKNLKDCIDNKEEDFLVIRHVDCWNNNFLFFYNEEESKPQKVKIIDWQFGIFGNPLVDLCTYLFCCCSRKELEKIEDLLDTYYETLSCKLKELGSKPEKCFPKENLRKSLYRYVSLAIAVMPIEVKICYVKNLNKNFNIEQVAEDGNFNGIIAGEIDETKYFDRLNGIIEVSIERQFI